jgi:hypothetical protein
MYIEKRSEQERECYWQDQQEAKPPVKHVSLVIIIVGPSARETRSGAEGEYTNVLTIGVDLYPVHLLVVCVAACRLSIGYVRLGLSAHKSMVVLLARRLSSALSITRRLTPSPHR